MAREVGIEGKLGGQARVPGVAGTWKDLTDNVNFMASNLTTQVRGIVKVVTAVANGDLTQKLVGVEAKGEIAALADTINNMCDTLGTFADQVSTVAREVGIEGKLGGQAKVPGAVGTWRQLTDNVNQLAGNLTSQVRAISDVATAVTKGDLTRSIEVEAQGEVAALKDKINQMIINLRETTQKNAEQDWLKTNLAKFSSMMQGQKNLETVSRLIMSELTPLVSAHHGAFFMMDAESESRAPVLKLTSTYAYRERKGRRQPVQAGRGAGRAVRAREEDHPADARAGRLHPDQLGPRRGDAAQHHRAAGAVRGEVKAVIELASFHAFSAIHQLFLDQLMREHRRRAQHDRRQHADGGAAAAVAVADPGAAVAVERADHAAGGAQAHQHRAGEAGAGAGGEGAAARRAEHRRSRSRTARSSRRGCRWKRRRSSSRTTSKYKSEFLANMSHELRTPLNSLLILAKLLSDNPEKHLTPKEVEYAKTIYASGGDLLTLINEILDLSKVEAGKMPIEPRDIQPTEIADFVDRSFRALAEQKGLNFSVDVELGRGAHALHRSAAAAAGAEEPAGQRLQVHRRRRGHAPHPPARRPGTRFSNPMLAFERVVAFSVVDTGIGIPENKQELIFEAFQQADGTTSRRYGGTGLGLSISREIARHLGGEIQVESEPGKGSVFTLYLPERYIGFPSSDEERWHRRLALARSGSRRVRPAFRSPPPPRRSIWPRSPAARCWWSTTTSATCSP